MKVRVYEIYIRNQGWTPYVARTSGRAIDQAVKRWGAECVDMEMRGPYLVEKEIE